MSDEQCSFLVLPFLATPIKTILRQEAKNCELSSSGRVDRSMLLDSVGVPAGLDIEAWVSPMSLVKADLLGEWPAEGEGQMREQTYL